MLKKIIALIFFIKLSFFSLGQEIKISGTISSYKESALEDATITTLDGKYSVKTNNEGKYQLKIPAKYKKIHISKLEYKTEIIDISKYKTPIILDVKLEKQEFKVDTIIFTEHLNSSGTKSIDTYLAGRVVGDGSIEKLIISSGKAIGPGSTTSNQYSVRGGSFDENIIYVNGIEIYRPQLIRSGQQEGLSFINPDMVSSINFSAGGFGAEYGDKMSSVLDIKYKRASDFGGGFSASMLGGSAFYHDLLLNKKLSILLGARYKTNKYLLSALETKGEYNPVFLDIQSYINYSISSKSKLGLLINAADNSFEFVPKSSKTNFGTIDRVYGLYTDFEGNEKDKFLSYTGALNYTYFPSKESKLSITASSFYAQEAETFDIIGSYSLNELNNDPGSEDAGDSLLNLGVGRYMEHARNFLDIQGNKFILNYETRAEDHNISFGTEFINENISDLIDEWNLLDSAGYSIPYSNSEVILQKNLKAKNTFSYNRYSAFIQDQYKGYTSNSRYEFMGGVRATYHDYSKEWLFSPRFSAAYKPMLTSKVLYRFSTGLYYQPPFYKELKNFDGEIQTESKSQRSIHFVLGNEYFFKAFGRNLKLITEVFYKKLDNLVPFEVDNVKIQYYADLRSSGYATGIDTKISGQFVPGVESWFSLSWLKTEEKIQGLDSCGYIPRPTDQRVYATLFIQDYVPGYKNFKVHLNLIYATGFPFGPPETGRCNAYFRSSDYKRVDLGASAVLLKEDAEKKKSRKGIFKNLKSIWLTIEVFNLANIKNTISYSWLYIVPNTSIAFNNTYDQVAVANSTTLLRFNLKLTVKF